MKTVTVDGVEYAPVNNCGTDVRIVVLQRGWVVVGYYERTDSLCTLRNCAVIQKWGTTKGLPEIASGGPTSSTALNKHDGIFQWHPLTEVFTISADESKWKKHLK